MRVQQKGIRVTEHKEYELQKKSKRNRKGT